MQRLTLPEIAWSILLSPRCAQLAPLTQPGVAVLPPLHRPLRTIRVELVRSLCAAESVGYPACRGDSSRGLSDLNRNEQYR